MTVVEAWLGGASYSKVPTHVDLSPSIVQLIAEGIAINSTGRKRRMMMMMMIMIVMIMIVMMMIVTTMIVPTMFMNVVTASL